MKKRDNIFIIALSVFSLGVSICLVVLGIVKFFTNTDINFTAYLQLAMWILLCSANLLLFITTITQYKSSKRIYNSLNFVYKMNELEQNSNEEISN